MLRLLTIAFLTGVLVTPVFAQLVPNTLRKETISQRDLSKRVHTMIMGCLTRPASLKFHQIRPVILMTLDARGNIIDLVDTIDAPESEKYIGAIRRCGPFPVVAQFAKRESDRFMIPIDFTK